MARLIGCPWAFAHPKLACFPNAFQMGRSRKFPCGFCRHIALWSTTPLRWLVSERAKQQPHLLEAVSIPILCFYTGGLNEVQHAYHEETVLAKREGGRARFTQGICCRVAALLLFDVLLESQCIHVQSSVYCSALLGSFCYMLPLLPRNMRTRSATPRGPRRRRGVCRRPLSSRPSLFHAQLSSP